MQIREESKNTLGINKYDIPIPYFQLAKAIEGSGIDLTASLTMESRN